MLPIPQRSLDQLEAVISNGLQTFVEVGEALLEIRDRELYRKALGFKTFEDYCRGRWKWGRNYVNKQIAAFQVVRNLGTNVPTTEAQARELTRLSPDQQREVAATIDFSRTTAEQIRERVQEYQSRGASPAAALLSVREDVRDELHSKLPSPAAARDIAIKTGAHTLDWNGDYQAPMTREDQAEVKAQRQLLQPLAEFLQWVGTDLSPELAAEIIRQRAWQSWLVGDDPGAKVTVSMEFGSTWLHKLAEHLSGKEKR